MFLDLFCKGWLDWILPCDCCGCAEQITTPDKPLCYQCLSTLAATEYEASAHEKVAANFWGRITLQSVIAAYPLRSDSILHRSLHQLKYDQRPGIGLFLGKLAGSRLIKQQMLPPIDAIIPLPLHPAKKRKRGYNQAERIGQGLSIASGIPVWNDVVRRHQFTQTQTHKDRVERWANMQGKFSVRNGQKAEGKHLLLVDDVLTTGATLEACGQILQQIPAVQLSFFTLAYTENG
ncbi:MAG: ComF family protein [Bacteroidota bacterium]